MKSVKSVDRLPREADLTHYRDTGCLLWSACLTCPFPRCIHDDNITTREGALHFRYQAIYDRWLAQEKKNVTALAREFAVNLRTVHRAISRCRSGPYRRRDDRHSPRAVP